MRAGNIKVVKDRFPLIWDNIRKYEYEDIFEYKVDKKNDEWILFVEKNGYEYPINSTVDPYLEASFIVENNENYIKDKDKLIIVGVGLGYLVDIILDKYPDKKIAILEHSDEILYTFLSRINLNGKKYRNIEQIFLDDDSGMSSLEKYINKNFIKSIGIIELPVYDNIFGQEYQESFLRIGDYIKKYKSSLSTNLVFQKRWIINSVMNMKSNLNTKSIQNMPDSNINGKNVIIVAAGPSLNYEIENLKKIRANNSAILFAVGSAINTLIENNIYPHAALTYDPHEVNVRVYEKIIDRGITEVPLIYGSSVGFSTIKNYPGELVHMFTSQDTVSTYFLRKDDELKIVYDAPSIAVVTLQLLMNFKPKSVIFVGQNLGYFKNRFYASGIDYAHLEGEDKDTGMSKEYMDEAIEIIDVDGNKMFTSSGMLMFKKAIETVIERYKNVDVEFINTTVGGAKIEGTDFVSLNEIMNKKFIENDVKSYIFDYDLEVYDIDYIKERRNDFNDGFIEYKESITEIIEIFNKMNIEKNPNIINKLMNTFDKSFEKAISSDFYKVILRPMNRVSHNILLKRVHDMKYEKNLSEKVNLVINNFGQYIAVLEKDIEQFIEYIRWMDDILGEYVEKNKK